MELDFAYLLRDKGAAEGSRIQIKTSRVRRVARSVAEGLVETGLSKIRRKQLFEDEADAADWLLFRMRTGAELQERMEFLQLEPELTRIVAGLWEKASHKVDVHVCINLAALDKVTTNLSARITEILGRYGITLSSGAARPGRDATHDPGHGQRHPPATERVQWLSLSRPAGKGPISSLTAWRRS